jgi:hypothetical protein
LIQFIDCALRPSPGQDHPTVVNFLDVNVGVLEASAQKRLAVYRNLGGSRSTDDKYISEWRIPNMAVRTTIQSKDGLKTVELTRRKAIRERCLNCSAWSPKEVETCELNDCPLYAFRMSQGKQNAKARSKALVAYCRWCMGGHRPSGCVATCCPLYSYRKGRVERPVLPKNARIEGGFNERDVQQVPELGLGRHV